MRFKIKKLKLTTGWPLIVVIREEDARKIGFHPFDRVRLKSKNRECIAMLDISSGKSFLKKNEIGLFQEVVDKLCISNEKEIKIYPAPLPKSLRFIKKKMKGKKLDEKEIYTIIEDITERKLSQVEMAYFVTSVYINKFNFNETFYLTKAMVKTGEILKLKSKIVLDKHCIGGVPGNRTSMLIVPIVAANGLTMPKTSSRAITSPAGTADTMEVLANVNADIKKIKEILKKIKGCIVWGGSVNLAPSDDQIIKIEKPMSVDAESQLLASVMAKKASVSATHLLIDIPYGKNAKCSNNREGKELAGKFKRLANKFKIKTNVILTNGSHPIGNGVGPALEAIDIMKILSNEKDAPRDLRAKGLYMAGLLLEMAGKAKKGKGIELALKTLISGKALRKMNEIIDIQGRKVKDYHEIKLGKFTYNVIAEKSGRVKEINNILLSKVASIAGAPGDKGAGVYLFKHIKDKVKKGEKLFKVYCESKDRMREVKKYLKENDVFVV